MGRLSAKVKGVQQSCPRQFLQVIFCDVANLHQRLLQSNLQAFVFMDRDRRPFPPSLFPKDMVASVNPLQFPTLCLQYLAKFFAGYCLHTANSITSDSGSSSGSSTSTDKHPMIASCMFPLSSSSVSPWDTHPGIDGTSPQKPPSSALWTTTLMFIPQTLPDSLENSIFFVGPASGGRFWNKRWAVADSFWPSRVFLDCNQVSGVTLGIPNPFIVRLSFFYERWKWQNHGGQNHTRAPTSPPVPRGS